MGSINKIKKKSFIIVAIMFMLFYTAPLFTYCPLRFSELGAIMIIWFSSKQTNLIQFKWPSVYYILLGIWIIFDGILLSTYGYFQIFNYIPQSMRLFLGIAMFITLPSFFKLLKLSEIITILRKVLIINLWIQVSYVILYPILGHYLFNVISSGDQRMALISENYKFLNHLIIVNTQKGFPQFSGIFDEPAWFGWNLNLLIATLLQFEVKYRLNILRRKDWLLIIVGYLFTFSIAAIGGLFIIWGCYYIYNNQRSIVKVCLSIGFGIVMMILFVVLNPSLLNRMIMIKDGGDGSTSSRLIGSWNAMLTVIKNNILTGYGLGDGNMVSYFSEILSIGKAEGIVIMNTTLLEVHNIIVQVLCNLGLIGFILYFTPILSLCKKSSIIIFIGLITVYFSVNVFNSFYLFFMTALALYYFTNIYSKNISRI